MALNSSNSSVISKLNGIFVPLITPVVQSGAIAEDVLLGHVDYVIRNGVSGLFLLGTTGNGMKLNDQQRYKIVSVVAQHLKMKSFIITGIWQKNRQEAVEEILKCAQCGARAVAIPMSASFTHDQRSIIDFYMDISSKSPLPVIMYNNARLVGVNISKDTVFEILRHPNVIGIKDSSNDFIFFQQILEHFAGNDKIKILQGSDYLLGWSILAGANGGMNGWANILPQLYWALYESGLRGDLGSVKKLQQSVNKLLAFSRPNPMPAIWTAAKILGLWPKDVYSRHELLLADRESELKKLISVLNQESNAYRLKVVSAINEIQQGKLRKYPIPESKVMV
ncbi:MAG: dihydrodipicolinate synthase family protein [Sedimentisphaerales bacterium]